MKSITYLFMLFGLTVTGTAHAGSAGLRIICEGEAEGAQVFINGKFKGECPLDMQVQEGQLQLHVQKATDAEHETRIFQQQIYMGEGVMKKVEVQFGPIQLNAAGRQRVAEAQRRQEEENRQAILSIESGMVAIPGKNYAMGKYEVTQAQWKAIMGSNPSHLHCEPRTVACSSDNNPVEQVSWNDIQDFLQKLNTKTGKQYRLPTKSEWEYACYGGSQTEFCGSNDSNAVGWFNNNSHEITHAVGQKQANGYGLYDMSGNVWEWLNDGPEECNGRSYCTKLSLCGGSYLSTTPVKGCGNYEYHKNQSNALWGFRLTRSLP